MINYAKIKYADTSNGLGVRTSIYFSGCTRHCKGCFNPETWSFSCGECFTPQVIKEVDDSLKAPYVAGVSLLGGDPLEPALRSDVLSFLKHLKEAFPTKNVWLFTGYEYDELMGESGADGRVTEILALTDVLKCGPFVEAEAEAGLVYKGSRNQIIYDLNATRRTGSPVLWREE